MAHKSHEIFQRLSSKSRALSTSKARYAWRSRTKRKALQLTPAEKAQRAESRRIHQQDYKSALSDARATIMAEAVKLREQFGGHSVDYYYEEIIQRSRLDRGKRKVTRWNVYLKQEARRLNDALPPDEPRKKLGELTAKIAQKWNTMTHEEQIAITNDGLKVLEDEREMKQLSRQNVPINAFNDTRSNLEKIEREVLALHARTGTEVLIMAVRSSADHYNPPYTFFTSPRVSEFFDLGLKEPVTDVALRLEAFCLAGLQGVVSNYVQTLLNLKSQLSALILSKLRAVARTAVPRMYYQNFDNNITAKYGVVIDGWPLEKFCSPSDITSRTEVSVLYQSWESGVTRFRKLTPTELANWENKRFEAKRQEEATGASTGHHDSTMHGTPIPVPSLDASQATPTATPTTAAPPPPPLGEKRPAQDEDGEAATRRKLGPFINFEVTSADGTTAVVGMKKKRKERSDKGKKRGKRAQG